MNHASTLQSILSAERVPLQAHGYLAIEEHLALGDCSLSLGFGVWCLFFFWFSVFGCKVLGSGFSIVQMECYLAWFSHRTPALHKAAHNPTCHPNPLQSIQ